MVIVYKISSKETSSLAIVSKKIGIELNDRKGSERETEAQGCAQILLISQEQETCCDQPHFMLNTNASI